MKAQAKANIVTSYIQDNNLLGNKTFILTTKEQQRPNKKAFDYIQEQ